MKEVTVQELKKMRDNNEVFQLIDVREIHEAEQSQIGGCRLNPSTFKRSGRLKWPGGFVPSCRPRQTVECG